MFRFRIRFGFGQVRKKRENRVLTLFGVWLTTPPVDDAELLAAPTVDGFLKGQGFCRATGREVLFPDEYGAWLQRRIAFG